MRIIFSLQLQTVDGNFHFFMKSNCKHWNDKRNPYWPAGYHSALGGPRHG